MKAKTFEKLLRTIVREEIDYSLRREIKTLKEDLRNELKPTIIEHTQKLVEVPKQSKMSEDTKTNLRNKISGNISSKSHKKLNFTNNSTLNALLNETAQGDTNLESGNASVNMAQPFSSAAPMSADTAGMPTEVANAMTRDYSGLMKAIDKKKGK